MKGGKKSGPRSDKSVSHTGDRVFPNGSILELVQISSGELNFLHWDGKAGKVAGQFVANDETLVPLRLDPTILRSMHLPSGVADYGSTRKLFTEISDLILRVTGMGDSVALPLTFFVLATWMVDRLPIAPFVWIVAPPNVASAPIVRLLGLLFGEKDLEVRVTPRSLCITGMRNVSSDLEGETIYSERRHTHIFRVLTLPSEIDPENVIVTACGGLLEIKLLKVGSGTKVPILVKAASA